MSRDKLKGNGEQHPRNFDFQYLEPYYKTVKRPS